MSNAARQYGQPKKPEPNAAERDIRNLEQVHIKEAGQALRDAGVTHTSNADRNTPARMYGQASPAQRGNDVRRDMGVAQGERPQLSPDDRMRQAVQEGKSAGQQLAAAGVKHSPAQEFGREQGARVQGQHGPSISR
jgi:hypothetical protein